MKHFVFYQEALVEKQSRMSILMRIQFWRKTHCGIEKHLSASSWNSHYNVDFKLNLIQRTVCGPVPDTSIICPLVFVQCNIIRALKPKWTNRIRPGIFIDDPTRENDHAYSRPGFTIKAYTIMIRFETSSKTDEDIWRVNLIAEGMG